MAGKKWMLGWVGLVVLAGLSTLAYGGVGFTADVTQTGTGWQNLVFGWTFEVRASSSIFVTHVGVYDDGGDGLATAHEVGIWYGAELKKSVAVPAGGGGEYIDGYRYVELVPPLELQPNPIPPGPAYTLGVLLPADNADNFIEYASDVVFGGGGTIVPWWSVNYPGCYSRETWSPVLTRPLNAQLNQKGLNVNFRYAVPGPTANAGSDAEIYTSEQALTTIAGTATHTAPGTAMQYQWFEGETPLSDLLNVGADGAAPLSLGPVDALSIGVHTLTLHVTDGVYTSDDSMLLTVANTPPEGQLTPTYQVLEIGTDAVIVQATVADFDGDTVDYQWVKDGVVLSSGTVTPAAGGTPMEIDDLVIPAGAPQFPLGANQVQFLVSDRVNAAVTEAATVMMQDTSKPTLAPTSSVNMLWPPNHDLIPVTIWANGEDNGGGNLLFTATVQCSEDDGGTDPDSYVDGIDNVAGTVALRLRAERSGTGQGRVYTVTVTATDGSGNQSVATVDIRVPHDKRKK